MNCVVARSFTYYHSMLLFKIFFYIMTMSDAKIKFPPLKLTIIMQICVGKLRKLDCYCKQIYSKTCVKQSLENRQNKDLNDKW